MVSFKLKNNPRKVLISQIGQWSDTARFSFTASALKKAWNCEVTLLTEENGEDWAQCLSFDKYIFLASNWFFSRRFFKRFYEKTKLWFELVLGRFDLVIELNAYHPLGLCFKLGFCSNVIGVQGEGFENRKRGYSYKFTRGQSEGDVDFVVRILRSLGVEVNTLDYKLKVHEPVKKLTEKRLQVFELPPKNFIAINPGIGEGLPKPFILKRWPFMGEFIRLALEKSNFPILLLGEIADNGLVLPLTAINPKRVYSWVGQASREEMIWALHEARAYVGSESGLSQLAGCIGTPGVVLYGPSSPKLTQTPGLYQTLIPVEGKVPCSPCYQAGKGFNWQCGDNACMKAISPMDVWQKLSQIAQI